MCHLPVWFWCNVDAPVGDASREQNKQVQMKLPTWVACTLLPKLALVHHSWPRLSAHMVTQTWVSEECLGVSLWCKFEDGADEMRSSAHGYVIVHLLRKRAYSLKLDLNLFTTMKVFVRLSIEILGSSSSVSLVVIMQAHGVSSHAFPTQKQPPPPHLNSTAGLF